LSPCRVADSTKARVRFIGMAGIERPRAAQGQARQKERGTSNFEPRTPAVAPFKVQSSTAQGSKFPPFDSMPGF
jgi:hypothetical protein